jgi:YtkA-like
MRKAIFVSALIGALVYAAPAAAGCWATVHLASPPTVVRSGTVWSAELTVLQHGRNPLPDAADARPTVTITNADGIKKTFTAKPVDPSKGTYSAEVVFPSAGRWIYAVFDDFTTWNGEQAPCARTHQIGAATMRQGPPSGSGSETSGFGGWPLAGAAAGMLALGAGLVLLTRRRRTAVA